MKTSDILLFILIKICETLIVLPIYTDFLYEEDSSKLKTKALIRYNIQTIYTSKIFTNLSIGNPEQIIPSIITFQSPILFINGNGTYNYENSISFELYNNSPQIIKMEIQKNIYSYSYFCIENFNFKNLFNTYQNYSIHFHIGYVNDNNWILSGENYIGLSPQKFKQDNELIGLSFISQLKKKGIIFSNTFTFDFNKNNKNYGNIIIGNYPHEYDPKKYNVNNFRVFGSLSYNKEDGNVWILNFNYFLIRNFTYLNDNLNENVLFEHEGKYDFMINYEINFISLDAEFSSFLATLIENVYGDLCKNIIINYRSSEKFIYICNETIDIKKFPSLIFKMKPIEHVFELDYTDLFEKRNDTYFLLIVFSHYKSEREVGLPFLTKYNLVFQENERVVGYYLKNNEGEGLSLFVSILLISICINILFIIFFVRRYYKRKNIKNIDYTYINDKEQQIGGLDNIDSESLDS